MTSIETKEIELESIENLFPGTGDETEDCRGCSDECVGGTASRSAMSKTQ